MKAALVVGYLIVIAVVTVLCLPANGARSWTAVEKHWAEWMTDDRERIILAYADEYDVSYAMIRAFIEREKGQEGYEAAMKRVSGEITATVPQSNWMIAQTARMARIASREFTKRYNHAWASWRGPEAKFQERYAEKFIRFYCERFQQPSAGCGSWIESVMVYFKRYIGRTPAQFATVVIYRP